MPLDRLVWHATSVSILALSLLSVLSTFFAALSLFSLVPPSLFLAHPTLIFLSHVTLIVFGVSIVLAGGRIVSYRPFLFVVGRLALWPVVLTWRFLHLLGARPYWSRVVDGLYVGSPPLGWDAGAMAAQGIVAVVNLCEEWALPEARPQAAEEYCFLPTVDHCDPAIEDVVKGVAFVERCVAEGRGVLVHCKSGMVRVFGVELGVSGLVGIEEGRRECKEEILCFDVYCHCAHVAGTSIVLRD